MYLYSVKDRLANEYAPVFEAKNDNIAERVVKQMMAKMPDIVLSDFELYLLGSFDHETGEMQVREKPELISNDFKMKEETNA